MKLNLVAVLAACFVSLKGNENGSGRCHDKCICLESYVDCSNRQLKNVPDKLPPWVQTLDLSNNSLEGFNATNDLTNYKLLNKLNLDQNVFTTIPINSSFHNLSSLSLRQNQITDISYEVWDNVPKLNTLDLSFNNLKILTPDMFPKSASLTSLNLSDNNITQIVNGSLAMKKLADLKLSRNNIFSLRKETFKYLNNLKKLELNKNYLTIVEGLTFKGLDKLISLKIRLNSIVTLEDGAFFGLKNLHTLKLDHNYIRSVSKSWTYGLDSLQEMHLGYNKIKTIEEDSWDGCENLIYLDLSNNEINDLRPHNLKGLTKLQTLKLDNNMISTISEGVFNSTPSLKALELNHNRISWIVEDMSGAFHGLKQLNRLGLAANEITSVNQKAFVGLASLTELDLSKNSLKTIQENSFGNLLLKVLIINTSSLICDCALAWFPVWLQATNVQFSPAYCAYPELLKGKSVTKVPLKEFYCSENDSPKPLITEGPKSMDTVSGNNVQLSCKAWSSANSSLTFKWKRNNDDVTNKNLIILNNTAKLVFENIQLGDAGKYQCIVSNHFGTAYSDKATLTVLVLPVMVKKPVNVTVRAGSTVKLECAATGEPTPQVGWQKDGGTEFPAAQERRMHVMPTDDVFYIVNAKPNDSGLYSCIAKNTAGTVTANTTLTVHEAPTFIKKMEDKEISIGKSTVLECMGSGWPKPKLRWWKDGIPLLITPRHILTADDQLLIIMDVKPSDAGLYQCAITNSLGTEKTRAQLIIAPAFSATAEDITGVIIITVVCCAVGTSSIWVIIIYQTRKRFQSVDVAKRVSVKLAHLDTKSELSASSKDSGTGDSTKRSSDDIQLETNIIRDYQSEGMDIVVEVTDPLLNETKTICKPKDSHLDQINSIQRQNTRNNHDRCDTRPFSTPVALPLGTHDSIPHHNSYMCLYVAPKPAHI